MVLLNGFPDLSMKKVRKMQRRKLDASAFAADAGMAAARRRKAASRRAAAP
jgi:hypothetical protein